MKTLTPSQLEYHLKKQKRVTPEADGDGLYKELSKHFDIDLEAVQNVNTAIIQEQAQKAGIIQITNNKKEVFFHIDETFLERNKTLSLYRNDENIQFCEYKDGVYVLLSDIDVLDRLDALMVEMELFEQRLSSRQAKDTLERVKRRLAKKRYTPEDINSKYINLKNGLLDTTTWKMKPHTEKVFTLSQVPYDYDAKAKAPKFKKHIDMISQGDSDKEMMLKQLFGYSIVAGNSQHKIFYLYGETARNGKSMTIKVLMGLIGLENCSSLSLSQLASDNTAPLVTLVNKQINFSDEVHEKFIDSANLTNMSAEGYISINPKYKQPYQHQVKTTFIVACNDLPEARGNQGINNRMIVIPFNHKIPEGDRIQKYEKILLEEEAAGILNWAIKGAKSLQNGEIFVESTDSQEEKACNIESNNSVLAYINEEYEFIDDEKHKVPVRELYGEPQTRDDNPTGYILYCKRSGVRPVSLQKFSREVTRLVRDDSVQFKHKKGSDGRMVYTHIIRRKDDLENF